jgi:hypothetical protein
MLPNGTNTYAGIIVAVAPTVLSLFGLTPTPAFNEDFPALFAALLQLCGAGYAFYGRARATVPGWFSKVS